MSNILWVQHGGSGYGGMSRADILDMTWDEIEFHERSVRERRRAEAEAIRKHSR